MQHDHETYAKAELDLHQFLTFRLSQVHARLNAQASALLGERAGVTLAQWRLIALIGSRPGTKARDIEREASLNKGQISRNLAALIRDGYVASSLDEGDRRAQRLRLTAFGRSTFEDVLPLMRERQRRLREAIGRDALPSFEAALDRLERAAEWRGEREGERT